MNVIIFTASARLQQISVSCARRDERDMPSAVEEETAEVFYASQSAGGNIELWALCVEKLKWQGKE